MPWDGRQGYRLTVEDGLCNDCGLCEQVCPGPSVDFRHLSDRFLTASTEDARLGRFLSCYVGHAQDEGIRWDAASGGIVTALLVAGLREGLFDAALVTRMRPESPLEPMPVLARTEAEIRAATGSKYCPVAANLRLRDILETDGRFAIVGLPCHIHGLRMAQAKVPKLRRRVAVCIALFCGLNMSPLGTRVALRRRRLAIEKVVELRYRGNGWPGDLQVRLRDGQTYSEGLYSYFSTPFSAYQMHRCTLCSDALGELADLSCGDAWLPEYTRSDHRGTSVVIVRDARAESLLARVGEATLKLAPMHPDRVAKSQRPALLSKKERLQAKASLARLAGKQTPVFEQELPSPGLRAYAGSAAQILVRGLHRRWHRIRGDTR
jgi:coenzyme F420 hydrogenase subunit beta